MKPRSNFDARRDIGRQTVSPSEEPQDEQAIKEEEIQERTAPTGDVVYQAIYREGEHEIERNSRALAWSGLAAGLSMGFSFMTEALLRSYLPDTPWRPAVTKFGYAIGFLIVILGRQQLFTKNTLTVMLPLLKRKEARLLREVGRLWAIVLLTNVVGAFAFALFIGKTALFNSSVHTIFTALAIEGIHPTFRVTLLHSIVAGWLIALMVWLLPFAESARVWVIVLLAYVVGLGHFSHIVAGTIPGFYLLLNGAQSLAAFLSGFFVPVLLGNIIGGVALVAALAHAEFIYEGHHEMT